MKTGSFLIPLVTLVLAAPASAVSVIDSIHGAGAGSFEVPTQSITNYITLRAGSPDLTGWTVGSGSIDVVKNNVWSASHGIYSLDMNGTLPSGLPDPGSISTTFGTIVGATYQLQFDISGYLGYTNTTNPKVMEVAIKSVNLLDEVAEISKANHLFVATNNANTLPLALSWDTRTVSFTATETRTRLTFTSKNTTNQSAMLLDNVRVELVSVPEPSAALLLGAASFVMIARRRRCRGSRAGD
jgi:choice-of-anchor C domain-containing protein